MLKKVFAIGMCAAALSLPAGAQLTREASGGTAGRSLLKAQEEVPLPANMKHRKGEDVRPASRYFHYKARAKKPVKVKTPMKAPARAASDIAANLQGALTYSTGWSSGTKGWYTNVTGTSQKLAWRLDTEYRTSGPSAGFVKDGKVYFLSYTNTTTGITDAGYKTFDLATGNKTEEGSFDIFNGLDVCVYHAAYDSDNDVVYVVTSNKSGNAGAMQTYDPATHTFTHVADVSEAMIPLAFAWCPVDGALYSIDDMADLYKWDYTAKRFTKVGSTGFPVDAYLGAMVYSPADKGFIAILDEADYGISEIVRFPIDGRSYTVLGDRANNEQWGCLYVDDAYAAPGAPAMLENVAIDFAGAALNGTVTVTLPTKDTDGTALTDRVYVRMAVDGTQQAMRSGNPGETVSAQLTVTEGEHEFKLTPYVYSGLDELRGAPTTEVRYIGTDTPAAPATVTLTATTVTWSAVTSGAHNGYVDVAGIKYNVYVDGQKMNQAPVGGTSLAVTMPAGSASHKAAVEAVGADGKVSVRTESESIVTSNTLELPVYIAPAEGEQDLDEAVIDLFEIIDVNGDGRTWNYDRQTPFTGGFYQLCAYDDTAPSDDWLMLPGINFPDASGYYKLEMEVGCPNHPFQTGAEVLEVAVGPSANPSAMTVITPATEYVKNKDKEVNWVKYEQIFQVGKAGVNYIGLHCVTPTNIYRIYARKFRVTAVNTSANAPGAVTDLTLTPGALGALNATASFKLPTTDRTGAAIATGTVIKAVVKCGEATSEVSGTPGQAVNATVATKQGLNDIAVTTWTGDVEGETVHGEVYTGEDLPLQVDLDYSISADNLTLTLNWTLPTTGPNGHNVDPTKCTYVIARYMAQSNTWVEYATVEGLSSWTFSVPAGSAQEVVQFGVQARNIVGAQETFPVMSAVLGKPYALPMTEAFSVNQNDEVQWNYNPYFFEELTYLAPSWLFADPATADPSAANASGVALCTQYVGTGQVTLPKFSTAGCSNVKVGLDLFFGAISVKLVEVFATCDDVMMQPIASYTPTDGQGWELKEITLPAAFNNKQWVAVTIRVTNEDYSCYFMMDRFEIRNLEGVDFKVTELTGDFRLNMGDRGEYFASIENNGAETAPAPNVSLGIYRGKQLLRTLDMIGDADNTPVAPGQRMDYLFELNADRALLGTAVMRLKIEEADGNEDNNTAETAFKVLNGNIPVVDDLEAEAVDGDVNLRWSEARIAEDCEIMVPWAYDEKMGQFKFVDRDGAKVYGLKDISYLGKYLPKAYQAISVSEIGNPLITSHSGDIVLMAMCPDSDSGNRPAEDYLISPEVKVGSKVSFHATSLTNEFGEETLKFMVSTTDDNPDSFTEVETYTLENPGWTRYDVTLPENARYFAIVYVSANRFGVLLDDFAFTPANPKATVNGFNVYRTNVSVASGVTGLTYTDANVPEGRYMYNVAAAATLNGAAEEGNMSNPVYITMESVGINGVDAAGKASIYALDGAVGLSGFTGHTVMIYTVDGRLVASAKVTEAKAVVPVAPGTYMVRCATTTAKLLVK